MRTQLTKEGRAAVDLGLKCLPAVSKGVLGIIVLAVILQGMRGCMTAEIHPQIVYSQPTPVIHAPPPKPLPPVESFALPTYSPPPPIAFDTPYKLFPGFDPDPSHHPSVAKAESHFEQPQLVAYRAPISVLPEEPISHRGRSTFQTDKTVTPAAESRAPAGHRAGNGSDTRQRSSKDETGADRDERSGSTRGGRATSANSSQAADSATASAPPPQSRGARSDPAPSAQAPTQQRSPDSGRSSRGFSRTPPSQQQSPNQSRGSRGSVQHR